MRGRLWLEKFIEVWKESKDKLDASTDEKWTESMGRVMHKVGEKLHCGVYGKDQKPQTGRKAEYLGIDFMFFYKSEEDKWVLPIVIIEHENDFDQEKIEYSLWKILCVRSPVKVLICYQSDTNNVALLRQHLEDVIWQGGLLKGSGSELLVIIGDGSVTKKDLWNWGDHFKVYEWRNDTLKEIKQLEW
jgi:hypothetical protein